MDPDLNAVPGSNEPDWQAFRRRARRRQSAMLALVLGPFILLVTGVRVFERHAYPQGDIRNESLLWAGIGLVAVVFVGAFIVNAVRVLREDH